MKLTIGSTTIDITSCTRMRDTKRGFYLDLQIPKNNIGMEALYSLLDNCTETIIITTDTGAVNEYKGFQTLGSFACENGMYKIAQVCTSEYEAQLSLTQTKVNELEIANHAYAEAINQHSEQVINLETASAMQSATIESMLLEAIPFIVETAVYTAVENVLGSILPPAGEESTDVPEEVIGDVVEEPVGEE